MLPAKSYQDHDEGLAGNASKLQTVFVGAKDRQVISQVIVVASLLIAVSAKVLAWILDEDLHDPLTAIVHGGPSSTSLVVRQAHVRP